MDKVIVVAVSAGLIGLILWWFFGKKETATVEAADMGDYQTVEIVADGAYVPNTVTLQQGKLAKLVFLRKDLSSCFEEVIFPDFGVSQKLPLGKTCEITINPDKVGEFKYSCGMHMFFGTVVVTDPERSRRVK